MAGTDYNTLMAMFGGLNQGASPEDIATFRNTVAANDIYRQVAAPVLGAKFNTSTWTPNQAIAATAAQAFLGSALNALGQRSEGQQMESLVSALPSVYKNPMATQVPEGVDPTAFNTLKASVMARGNMAEDLQKQKIASDIFSSYIERDKARNQQLGKDEALNMPVGVAGGVPIENPNSPKSQKLTDLQKTFNDLEAVQNFKYISQRSDQLARTLKNPTAIADPILAKMVVQFVEPKLSVNQGESSALAASASIPQEWKGLLAQAIDGKSRFNDAQRAALLQIAKAGYEAHGNLYKKELEQFQSEAMHFDIDPKRISSIGEPVNFDTFIRSILQKKAEPVDLKNTIDLSVLNSPSTAAATTAAKPPPNPIDFANGEDYVKAHRAWEMGL